MLFYFNNRLLHRYEKRAFMCIMYLLYFIIPNVFCIECYYAITKKKISLCHRIRRLLQAQFSLKIDCKSVVKFMIWTLSDFISYYCHLAAYKEYPLFLLFYFFLLVKCLHVIRECAITRRSINCKQIFDFYTYKIPQNQEKFMA